MLIPVNHCCSKQILTEGSQLANQMRVWPGDPSVSTLGIPTPDAWAELACFQLGTQPVFALSVSVSVSDCLCL